jgi:hypothetical protein
MRTALLRFAGAYIPPHSAAPIAFFVLGSPYFSGYRRPTGRWSITAIAALRAPRKRGVTLSLQLGFT